MELLQKQIQIQAVIEASKMNQNSWPVQVYCFTRHTHREYGIPHPTASRFPIPSQVGSRPIFQENPGNDADLFLVSLIPFCSLFKPSLLRT